MRLGLLVVVLVACIAAGQSIESIPLRSVALPSTSSGDIPVYIVDSGYSTRTELYLGDVFYLVFDLSSQSGELDVVIYLHGPDGTRHVRGRVSGGRVYGYGPIRIVEPIYEGRRYSFEVYVYRGGVRVGYGSTYFIERRCPLASLSIDSWSPFVVEVGGNVTINVDNRGERGWSYEVEVLSRGGSVKRSTFSISVPAGGSRSATFRLEVVNMPRDGRDELVVRLRCGGEVRVERSVSVEVVPPRPGPLSISAPVIEARLGEPVLVELSVTNSGWEAEVVEVSFSEGVFKPRSLPTVGRGGSGRISGEFTAARAGEYELEVVVKYRLPQGRPGSDRLYEDRARVRARVYARLSIVPVDHLGRPIDVTFSVGGASGRVFWLLPGTYQVGAPQTVQLGEGSRLAFAGWGDGDVSTTKTVVLRENTELRVVYNREHRVVLDLSPAFPREERWVAEGSVFSYTIPGYRAYAEGSRWAIREYSVGGVSRSARGDTSVSFTVSGPVVVSTRWVREHRVVVDCGEARCLEGRSLVERWVEEGGVFSARLERFVDAGARSRWRLEGDEEVRFVVNEPATVRARYVRQYQVALGYVVETARGRERPVVLEYVWVDSGGSITVDPERLRPREGGGVQYRLERVERDGAAVSRSVVVSAPHDVYVVWSRWYYVNVSSSVGEVYGSGWYLDGSYAKVEVAKPVTGFLVLDKFVKWVDDRGVEYPNATVVIAVDRPVSMYAVWEKDYTQAAALGVAVGVGSLVAWKRDYVKTLTKTVTRRRERVVEVEVKQPALTVEEVSLETTRVREREKE